MCPHILTAGFKIVQSYVPTEIFETRKKDAFYAQLLAIQVKIPNGIIVMVAADLNAKAKDNTFPDLTSTAFTVSSRTAHSSSTETARRSAGLLVNDHEHLINHAVISSRFRICLLRVRDKKGVDIGLEIDHHLMVSFHSWLLRLLLIAGMKEFDFPS